MPEAQTFYGALRPVLLTNLVVGLGCFVLRPNQWTKYLEIAYSSSYVAAYSVLMYFGTGYLTNQRFRSTLYVSQTLINGSFYINTVLAILLIIVMKFRSKKLQTSIKMIETCDRKILRMGFPKCYRPLYQFQLYAIAACTIALSINAGYMFYFEFLESTTATAKVVLLLLWNNLWLVVHVSDISFHVLLRHTNVRFHQLNELLRDMANASPKLYQRRRVPATIFDFETRIYSHFRDKIYHGSDDNASTMRVVKQTHLELIKIARMVNDAYGPQILLTTTVSFLITLCLFYIGYKILLMEASLKEFVQQIISVSCWILFFALKFCALNYTCTMTTATAADAGDIICELYESSTTKEFRVEIRDFMLQLIQNPLQFRACGFFNIDHSFLQTIVGTITTYLVILIQVGDTPKPLPPIVYNNVTVSTPEII